MGESPPKLRSALRASFEQTAPPSLREGSPPNLGGDSRLRPSLRFLPLFGCGVAALSFLCLFVADLLLARARTYSGPAGSATKR